MKKRLPLLVAALFVAAAAPAAAQYESQAFGGANFDFQKTGFAGCDEPCHIWKQTDYWAQTFYGSSLGSVGRLGLSLNIDNVLNSGASIDFDALVNGTTVGSFSFADSDPDGVYGFDYYFSPLSAANYRVELRITSPSVPDGQGSVGLALDGTSTTTIYDTSAIPEPLSVVLLASGLLGVGLVAWRRRETGEDDLG